MDKYTYCLEYYPTWHGPNHPCYVIVKLTSEGEFVDTVAIHEDQDQAIAKFKEVVNG